MKPTPVQNITGETTEACVARHLSAIGLHVEKPIPDNGIDLNVSLRVPNSPVVRVQVKGRSPNQKNKRYRWFQIRTTSAQREQAVSAGLHAADTWEKKVRMCDFFILVAQRYDEFWVFPQDDIVTIGKANREVYGNRADNRTGRQAELDLDIAVNGEPLTEMYAKHCNAFHLIEEELERRMAEQSVAPATSKPAPILGAGFEAGER
jgi:hypothetical protein